MLPSGKWLAWSATLPLFPVDRCSDTLKLSVVEEGKDDEVGAAVLAKVPVPTSAKHEAE